MNRLYRRSRGLALGVGVAIAVTSPVFLHGKSEPVVPSIVVVRSYDSAASDAVPADERLGFIVESDGIILTSYEVLRNARTQGLRQTVSVELVGDKSRHKAAIVGIEPTLNFAILKVESDGKLPASKLSPREKIQVGQKVRALAGFEGGKPVYNTGELTDLNSKECYQHSMTATMLRGRIEIPRTSIGGPVFNERGEVVAVFTGHVPPERPVDGGVLEEIHRELEDANKGKIHLLPIFLVTNIYESLKLKESLKSPWTGFSVRPITSEERKFFPFKRFRKTNNVAEFQRWLYAHGVGFEVKLHFLRGGKELRTVTYTIEERPKWAVPR